jgi:hypothetical protein
MLDMRHACVICTARLVASLLAVALLASCSASPTADVEVLIGLHPQAVSLLTRPDEPDPLATGIASLDALNRKWKVQQMVPVFASVSPDDDIAARHGLAGVFKLVAPAPQDLAAMIVDYEADPHIAYAETNVKFEIQK